MGKEEGGEEEKEVEKFWENKREGGKDGKAVRKYRTGRKMYEEEDILICRPKKK